jgi:hypothetical protein
MSSIWTECRRVSLAQSVCMRIVLICCEGKDIQVCGWTRLRANRQSEALVTILEWQLEAVMVVPSS